MEEFARLKEKVFAQMQMLKGKTSQDQLKLIEELTAKKL